MMRLFRLSTLFAGLFALATIVGCGQESATDESPEQAVEDAIATDGGDQTIDVSWRCLVAMSLDTRRARSGRSP